MIKWLPTILLAFSASAATAQGARSQERTAQEIEIAFRTWMQGVGAQNAVLSVQYQGRQIHDLGIGWAADAPVELASLGKAITAVCAATLIRDRIWHDATTSKALLGFGPDDLTVAQLATHSAGLGPDFTQGLMALWLDDPTPRSALAAKLALHRAKQGGTPGTYFYNNENYAVLGAMIEAQTGRPYAEICTSRALVPAGVQAATPSELTGSTLPWGGWQMPASDYAAFLHHWFGPKGAIGADPQNWPHATVYGPIQYGLGMFQREVGGAFNFWHFGAWCIPGQLNLGSYAVVWETGWSVVAAYDRCITTDDMTALDRALVEVVYRP